VAAPARAVFVLSLLGAAGYAIAALLTPRTPPTAPLER